MKITAQKILKAGGEVYLRKGTTVHSKFMIVDAEKTYITSYNFHPRSEKMEGEMSLVIYNQDVGQQMTQVFLNDITNPETSLQVKNPDDLNVSMGAKLWLILRLMYDQL
jgi:phosphatidylserine/phosphatidylglycerophosphate/cardiolipin synthase-like enzyme